MESSNSPIAIVGMSCRFSGDVTAPDQLWDMLADGRSGCTTFPESRFSTKGIYHPNGERIGSTNVKQGHFLKQDPAMFDAPFFNLSAEVASSLDPQFRLTLEIVYEAMESAGIRLSDFQGSDTSVYAGCMVRDYHDNLARDPEMLPRYFMTGNAATMASNRVSHFFDLHGPSMTIDTGCSTTLTALHLACQNLRSSESRASVVTGASLMLNPDVFLSMSNIGFLSPDGISYAFDHRANGYGRGEGVAAIILKRLDDAIADGDPIRAVIRGTALNQDGKTSTITTPSQEAQEDLMRTCYRQANIDPRETGYVEAHGTGTPTGDPIELRAIAGVLGGSSDPNQPLLVGSVKTAIGHTEAASGLASIIKVVLGLERGLVPPNSNFEKPNPKLDLAAWNIEIPTKVVPWPVKGTVRRASINNFGFGGANAHVVIEEYQGNSARAHAARTNTSLFRDDASTAIVNGLNGNDDTIIQNSSVITNGYPEASAHGLSVESIQEPYELVLVASDDVERIPDGGYVSGESKMLEEAEASRSLSSSTQLASHDGTYSDESSGSPVSSPSSIAAEPFKSKMSRVFVLRARDEESCRKSVANLREYLSSVKSDEVEQLLCNLAYTLGERRSLFPWVATYAASCVPSLIAALASEKTPPLRAPPQPRVAFVFNGQGAQWYAMGQELLHTYPVFKAAIEGMDTHIKDMGASWSLIDELNRSEDTTNIHNLEYSLPLCCALQIALVDLLRSWGVHPIAVTGHSSGEVAAAYAAYALDARSAIAIPYLRGALSAETESIIGQGGMIAIGLGREKSESYISRVRSGKVGVACVNSQNSITASGDTPAIIELESLLVKDGIFCRRLRINGAFHSPHMAPISETYMALLRPLLLSSSPARNVVFLSSMTGDELTNLKELATPEYWNANMLGVVEFESSFRRTCLHGVSKENANLSQRTDIVLEIGPHGSLGGPIQDLLSIPELKGYNITYLNCLVRKKNAVETMQALACELIRKGYPVDLRSVNRPSVDQEVRVISNLPQYPWAHHTPLWLESRINRFWRERKDLRHDILGAYQVSMNSDTPTWRNFLRPADLPWLRDHVVGSNIVYPGAAYICMAIEAATELTRRKGIVQTISGYQLRDVQFVNALRIPDIEGREVQLTMSSNSPRSTGITGWQEFKVYSVSCDNEWSQHCHGQIRTDFATSTLEDTSNEEALNSSAKGSRSTTFTRRVDPAHIFKALRSVGISHGSAFQNLHKVVSNRHESVVTFSVADTTSTTNQQSEYLIHPTTLDSIFQAAYSTLPGLGTQINSPYLPRSIDRLSIQRSISNTVGHQFETRLKKSIQNLEFFTTNLEIFDAGCSSSEAVLEIKGLEFRSADRSANQRKQSKLSEICSTIRWGPDLSSPMSLSALDHLKHHINPGEVDTIRKLRRAVVHQVQGAIATLTEDDIGRLEWHHVKYHDWMKTQLKLASENKLGPTSAEWLNDNATERAELLQEVARISVNGEMIKRMGPQISAVMRGEAMPLELMLEGGLLLRYYQDGLKWDRSTHQMGELLKALTHKNPRAKILEVGGGTGGGTHSILNAIGPSIEAGVSPTFGQYDFTDVSQGFFEAARRRFDPWKDLMTFKKLDIEVDPAAQDFDCGSYDIVVACQVLHATRSMANTMTNVRRLLKPGGKLVVIETTQDMTDVFMAFGLLPGWWLSEEEERKTSPSLSLLFLDGVLRQTGFTGLDYTLRDCEDDQFYSFSVAMSTAKCDSPVNQPDVVLITGPDTPPPDWLQGIRTDLAAIVGITPEIRTQANLGDFQGRTCIYLGDLNHTSLMGMDEAQFAAIKTMVSSCDGLLWPTRGASIDPEMPEASLSHGLLRSLRHEHRGKLYVTLDLDSMRSLWTPETAAAICQVFSATFCVNSDAENRDWEYAERKGVIHVPRLYRDYAADEDVVPVQALFTRTAVEPEAFGGPVASLTSHDAGISTELPPGYIELSLKAFRPNTATQIADISLQGLAKSRLEASSCSGVVARVDTQARDRGFKVGDRVCSILLNPSVSFTQFHWSNVTKIPDNMTFEVAAAIPAAYVAAYISLHEVAKVQPGEVVMVNQAASELGQAAIMLCQRAQAVVFATVGNKKEQTLLEKTLNISPKNISVIQSTPLSSRITKCTAGKGVNIILNSGDALLFQESHECLADFGRFVELGEMDSRYRSQLSAARFPPNTAFHTVDLETWTSKRPKIVATALAEIVSLVSQGLIGSPAEIKYYPLSTILSELDPIKCEEQSGMIVVSVSNSDTALIKRDQSRLQLRQDSSYMIVGGTGGVGKSLCEWMVDRGAKNLIILSRNPRADSFFSELPCNILVLAGDVSDESQLASALANCGDMPPIRGVLHAAMVLKDSVFEQMKLEDFKAALEPKVLGSWNLHRQFQDVDFFVMLSSILGITGSSGQANYTAGGAYQDSLACYRRARGLPATCIDLSMVQSVGYVAGDHRISDRLSQNGITMLQEDDVHRILDYAILGSCGEQISTGVNSGHEGSWHEMKWLQDNRFLALQPRESSRATSMQKIEHATQLRGLLSGEAPAEEASVLVLEEMSKEIMNMFGTQEVDVSKDLTAHGVDSLVAVELRNWLTVQTGVELPVLDLIQSPSLIKLAELVVARLGHRTLQDKGGAVTNSLERGIHA